MGAAYLGMRMGQGEEKDSEDSDDSEDSEERMGEDFGRKQRI